MVCVPQSRAHRDTGRAAPHQLPLSGRSV